jgi:hypothetical protein
MATRGTQQQHHIYEGSGDDLMGQEADVSPRIVLLPDAPTVQRDADPVQRIRIMWGQRLIDDVVAGRYRTLVCAVNVHDNSHGFIKLIAERLPTSQWREQSITEYAKHFVQPQRVTVVKYDMDLVEVLALLRPSRHEALTMDDLAQGFQMVTPMLHCRPDRMPTASVCFLGARANRLVDARGEEPSFESVLRVMYESGFRGDVYPVPWMWETAPTAMFPRYPFPDTLKQLCEGGF